MLVAMLPAMAASAATAIVPGTAAVSHRYGPGSGPVAERSGAWTPKTVVQDRDAKIHNLTTATTGEDFSATPRTSTSFPLIYGNVIYSASDMEGFYVIGQNGSFTAVNKAPYVGFTAVVLNDIYYSFAQVQVNGEVKDIMQRFSVKDAFTFLGTKELPAGSRPEVAATDGQTVYGCFAASDNAFYMGTLNLTTGAVTRIADTFFWQSAAFGQNGVLYVLDYSGTLYTVDKSTGAKTLVGSTGAAPKYFSGAAYDRRSGKLYWTVCPDDESGRLYEVNPSTGAATQLAKFRYNDQVTGLYIPYYADAVPAAPQALATDFATSSLSGNVTLTVPDKNYAGEALTFPVSCTITVRDASAPNATPVTKTVQVDKAGTLSVPMTVGHDGLWRLTAWLHNGAGEGPAVTTLTSVGNDQPSAPQNIALAYDGARFQLSWDTVRSSVNNGWLDTAAMTYKVVRYPDGKTIAENLTATSCTDAVAEPMDRQDYHYGVTAVCHGRASEEGLSPVVSIGCEKMPWSHEFSSEDSIAGFTIIDANLDGVSWKFNSSRKALMCSYNATLDMDDWVMSPGLRLEAGKVYKVTLKASCRNVKYPERIEAFLGKERTPAAMTMEVVPRTVIKTAYSKPLEYTGFIAIREDGKYYLGVHGCSEAGQYEAYLHDVYVSAPADARMPAIPDDFRVLPDSVGALGVTVSFHAPTHNMLGEALASISKIETWRDGALINTVTAPAPGAPVSFTETLPSKGDYIYKVAVYNSYGESPTLEKSIYVGGIPYPDNVPSLKAVETETAGSVQVTWPLVTTDQNGNPLDPSYIKYEIVNAKKKNTVVGTMAGNVNTFVWKALDPEADQETIKVGVRAVTDRGASNVVSTNNMYVGRDYTLPYHEGFPGGAVSHPMSTFLYGGTTAWNTGRPMLLDIDDADGDNGVAYYRGSKGEAAILHTGKITLANTTYPQFTFQVYNFGTEDEPVMDQVGAMVLNTETQQWEELVVKPVSQLPGAQRGGWVTVTADLSRYKGKRVQVGVLGRQVVGSTIVADNFRIRDAEEYNVAVAMDTLPSAVTSGKGFDIPVTVRNTGAKAVENVVVTLNRNSAVLRTENLGTIQPGDVVCLNLADTLNVTHEGRNTYQTIVAALHDNLADDNLSVEAVVTVSIPDRNRPTGLKAAQNSPGILLTWTAPQASQTGVEGYNIYRDQALLKHISGSECRYVDLPSHKDSYTYQVSAVYADGVESGASTAVSITGAVSGLDNDADGQERWYTPTGLYLGTSRPTAPGMYIHTKGRTSGKKYVK